MVPLVRDLLLLTSPQTRLQALAPWFQLQSLGLSCLWLVKMLMIPGAWLGADQ